MFFRISKRIYSPLTPSLTRVWQTVFLFIEPSRRIFVSTGNTVSDMFCPRYPKARQEAVRTFQKLSFSNFIRSLPVFEEAAGPISPEHQAAMARTYAYLSLRHFAMTGIAIWVSGIPMHPRVWRAISLTPTFGSVQTRQRDLITYGEIEKLFLFSFSSVYSRMAIRTYSFLLKNGEFYGSVKSKSFCSKRFYFTVRSL